MVSFPRPSFANSRYAAPHRQCWNKAAENIDGKLIIRETISMLEDKETGWIDYVWPKPGETEPAAKTAYIRKVTVGPLRCRLHAVFLSSSMLIVS